MKSKPEAGKENQNRTAALIVFTIIYISLYGRLLTDFFINIDDDVYFVNNPQLKTLSWENIREMFTGFYAGNYHPITSLLEAVQHALFGMNPKAFHLVNFLFHFINSILVYRLAGKLDTRQVIAYITVFVFAFHPMHVETVAWITDQTDIFMVFFSLMCFLYYCRFLKEGRMIFVATSILFLILALGSKPSAIAIPVVLFLFDYLHGKKPFEKIWLKAPYFLLAIIFAYITFISLDAKQNITQILLPDYTPIERFFVANYALSYYIICFFFPLDLAALHLAPTELSWQYHISPAINLAVCYGIFRISKKDRLINFGVLFFLFSISLVLQILPSGYNVVAERYTYFPYIGLSLSIAAVILHKDGELMPTFLRKNLKTLLLSFGIFFIILNYNYVSKWTSLVDFNINIAEHNPHSSYALANAASFSFEARRMEEAMKFLGRAEAADSKNPEVYFLKCQMDYGRNEKAAALRNLQLAQKLNSTRANLDDLLSVLYFENNQFDSAAFYFTKVIDRDSVKVPANYRNRAICHYNTGNYQAAIDDYNQILGNDSSLLNLFGERGVCYGKLGNREEACEDIKKAVAAGYEDFRVDLTEFCK